MANYERQRFPFTCRGMNLSLPVDTLPPEKYRLLQNVRPYGENQIQARQGSSTIFTFADVPHSAKRFDDPIVPPESQPGAFSGPRSTPAHIRLVGAGTTAYIATSTGNVEPTFFSAITDEVGGGITFSGDPLSFCVFKPDLNNRPWAIIADTDITVKTSSNSFAYPVGIAPPWFSPQVSLGSTNENGPDIGTTGRPYSYRFVARGSPDLVTGALSNPGPPLYPSQELSPAGQNIIVTSGDVHGDPQVAYLDVYRFGGSLPEWIYIGTITNAIGANMEDSFSDADIASNMRLEEDNNQPWLTVDSPRSGTCTVTAYSTGDGGKVTWVSGDTFKTWDLNTPYWVAGNTIVIGGSAFTIRGVSGTTNELEIVEDPPSSVTTGDQNWQINAPEMAHVSLPYLWGPFGTGQTGTFYFATGDPNRPGALYWTKGNNAESHPGTNVLDITSPSEPGMNGAMYDGKAFYLSTDRIFSIYPSFGGVSDFSAVEVPNTPGLLTHWAICSGPRVWYRAKDGIYEFAGASSTNISNADLYPIFPHEGSATSAYQTPGGFKTDSTGGTLVLLPVNDLEPTKQRMCYGDGWMYFDYVDSDGTPLTLVWDAYRGGWYSDKASTGTRFHYYEEGISDDGAAVHNILIGNDRANISKVEGFSDDSEAIEGHIRTGSRDAGDPRPRKFWGDIQIDLDSVCQEMDAQLGFDNFTFFTSITITGTNYTGRRRVIGDINNGTGQYAYNVGFDVTWSSDTSAPIFYAWEPSFLPKPEVTSKRITDYMDGGYNGAKFVQGFRLKADTLGQDREISVLDDNDIVQQTFTVNHDGEITKPYVFTTPFITHLLRMLPTDANFWRVYDVEWIWEPAPELVTTWITQETTLDFSGFFHHRDAYIALISNDTVTLTCTVETVPFPYSIGTTAGTYRKLYLVLQPMKGKAVSYSLTSPAGFRLYLRDCEVHAKQWGSTGPYVSKQPFGDVSRIYGAKI